VDTSEGRLRYAIGTREARELGPPLERAVKCGRRPSHGAARRTRETLAPDSESELPRRLANVGYSTPYFRSSSNCLASFSASKLESTLMLTVTAGCAAPVLGTSRVVL